MTAIVNSSKATFPVLSNLDLLRTVAVSFVVVDHSVKLLCGQRNSFGPRIEWLGSLGVMFFFVHTCAVLMMSLERSCGKFSTLRTVINFYVRRAFRIYPLSIAAVIVAVCFALPVSRISGQLAMQGAVLSLGNIAANLLLVQHVYHHVNIIGVLWSLPLEMQMYLVLPLLYFAFARKRRIGWMLGMWAAAWAAGAALRHAEIQSVQDFLPGILLFMLLKSVTPRLPAYLFPFFIAGLTFTFMSVHPSWSTGGIVCLGLGLLFPHFKEIGNKYVNLVTYNVAKYSYGAYLAHIFLLWLWFIHFSYLPGYVKYSSFAITLVLVPIALYHTLEEPLIRFGSGLASWKQAPKAIPAAPQRLVIDFSDTEPLSGAYEFASPEAPATSDN